MIALLRSAFAVLLSILVGYPDPDPSVPVPVLTENA